MLMNMYWTESEGESGVNFTSCWGKTALTFYSDLILTSLIGVGDIFAT